MLGRTRLPTSAVGSIKKMVRFDTRQSLQPLCHDHEKVLNSVHKPYLQDIWTDGPIRNT